jgi:putative addiction module component (TIGR02574 family)
MPMSPEVEQLFKAALALPEDERLELVEELLASQDAPGEIPFDPAWMGEVQRRSAEIDAGTAQPSPWSVVRERVRQRLAGRADG